MPIEVYKEPLYRRYYVSNACSSACIYMLVISSIMIFLPLFLAYNSTAFWIKDSTLYEQPHIQYKYQAIFQFYGERTTNTNGVESGTEKLTLYWSTESLLNDLHGDFIRPAMISSIETDSDRNGLLDKLSLNVELPTAIYDAASNASVQYQESITGLDALVFFEVRLQDRAKYIVDAATHFSYRNGVEGIGKLYVDSNVAFRQREKLLVKGGFQMPYQDDPLLPTEFYEDTSLGDVQMSTILAKSASRNLTLGLDHNYVYAEPASGASNFKVDFQLRIPHQYIIYSPGPSEVLKWAWVQYFSVFLVIAFLLNRMNSFVFTQKLLYANQVPDMVVKKMD